MKVGWTIGLLEVLSGSCGTYGEGDIGGMTISGSVGFSKFKVGGGLE